MAISVFDLFSIGIGPSSSHTVGPMRAAREFVVGLRDDGLLSQVVRLEARAHGSLASTGRGHGTDRALVLGLLGEQPETIDVGRVAEMVGRVDAEKSLLLLGVHPIPFTPDKDVVLDKRTKLPGHPNGMRFTAWDASGAVLRESVYYSVGGGFIVTSNEDGSLGIEQRADDLPLPFASAAELLQRCAETGEAISGVMLRNELTWRDEQAVRSGLLHLWEVMQECVRAGCAAQGEMPGLGVRRRAGELYQKLSQRPEAALADPLAAMDWVNLYALAVNEENAGGGRVVTAPTNGAAGIVPAVLHYYTRFCGGASDDGVVRFLLTAGAVGTLFKRNASISGAEVGCQGEVGSACSMAAAGLAEVLGGTPEQVENAAEIAMEHCLGLTCDPIGGFVQVPCIERNAMASIQAINATRLALRGDGKHFVSLDKVIKTMRDTGRDMKTKYKETSRGGLAVNVIEC